MSVSCQKRKWLTLFDHLIGNRKHARRNQEAERLSGLEIDDQLEPGRSGDREVGGLLTLEDAANIYADLVMGIGNARSVANQTTSRRVLAIRIDRGHPLS